MRRRPDAGHRAQQQSWHNSKVNRLKVRTWQTSAPMSFFSNFRADRLIAQIKSSTDILGTESQKSVARLKELGPAGIEAILAALPDADKHATVALVDVLASLATVKSFPSYVEALITGSPRVVAGVAWALTSSRGYPPHLLLEALTKPGVSKSAVLEIINAQRTRFSVRELLTAAYAQEANEKGALFRIIGEVVDEAGVPELLGRLQGKDTMARLQILAILGALQPAGCAHRAARPDQRRQQDDPRGGPGLARQAGWADGNRAHRRPAARSGNRRAEPRGRRADAGAATRRPSASWCRCSRTRTNTRAAPRSKCSTKWAMPIRSSSCWRRSRTTTGGCAGAPAMHWARSAARRSSTRCSSWCATRTKTSVAPPSRSSTRPRTSARSSSLIDATKDTDWWVSERAVDALAEIGSTAGDAAARRHAQDRPATRAADSGARHRQAGERAPTRDDFPAAGAYGEGNPRRGHPGAGKLATEEQAEQIRVQLQPFSSNSDQTLALAAQRALTEIEVRFASGVQAPAISGSRAISGSQPQRQPGNRVTPEPASHTLLIPEQEVAKAAAAGGRLDPATPRHRHAQDGRHDRRALQVHRHASARAPSAPCC